jgi:hypothetical protein
MLEIRGLGIRRVDFEPIAVVGLVVDLGTIDPERHPNAAEVVIEGVTLPRLAVAAEITPLPLVIAAVHIPPADN